MAELIELFSPNDGWRYVEEGRFSEDLQVLLQPLGMCAVASNVYMDRFTAISVSQGLKTAVRWSKMLRHGGSFAHEKHYTSST